MFDSVAGVRAVRPISATQPTPTASPTPTNLRIVATNIQIMAQVQEPGRILGGASESSRAELTPHRLRFHTPVLRESEVLYYAFTIAGHSPTKTLQVRARDSRGPAMDLSGDWNLHCDSSGVFTALTMPAEGIVAGGTSTATVSAPTAQMLPPALSDRAAALRVSAPLQGASLSPEHRQTPLVIMAGIAGVACLMAAIYLGRRRSRRRIASDQMP